MAASKAIVPNDIADDPSAEAVSRREVGWVSLLRSGGKARQAVIAQLYSKYGREFKGYFRRHGARDAIAEDLLQETFVKVLRSVDSWTGAGSLEAWLWSVARNTFLSYLRSEAPSRASVSLDGQEEQSVESILARGGDPSSDPADADCVKRGLESFAAAHAEYAHVLERVAVDGWSYAELAQFRECTLGAAREYLSQCRKRVWQFIGHCYQGSAA